MWESCLKTLEEEETFDSKLTVVMIFKFCNQAQTYIKCISLIDQLPLLMSVSCSVLALMLTVAKIQNLRPGDFCCCCVLVSAAKTQKSTCAKPQQLRRLL